MASLIVSGNSILHRGIFLLNVEQLTHKVCSCGNSLATHRVVFKSIEGSASVVGVLCRVRKICDGRVELKR